MKMEIYEFARKTYFQNISEITNLEENIHTIVYGLLAFFVPFMLGHPQLLVGTVVNASLFLAAVHLRGHKLLPIILLPSLGVLAQGLIFGPFTIFLTYMLPFIWLGNAALVYTFRALRHKKTNYAVAAGAATLLKTGLLFGAAFVMVSSQILPPIFLTAMGVVQLLTAALGAGLAFATLSVLNKTSKTRSA